MRKSGYVGGSELPFLEEQHHAGSALRQVHRAAAPPSMASCEQEVGRKGVRCFKCGLEGMGLQDQTK